MGTGPHTVNRVLLARHGQTEWNVLGRRQGQLDSPLTAAGLAQARNHAETLATQDVDAIFTSPLGRAATTAQIIAEVTGLHVTVVDDLAEVHHGDFAGLTNADITRRHPHAARERAEDKYHWRFPNGESYADADHRANKALRTIAEQARNPLIVSHEMIGRMLLRNLLAEDPHEALRRNQPHDVIYAVTDGRLTTPGTPAGSAATPPVPPKSH
jgi:broad specificity phosphatase PhoE